MFVIGEGPANRGLPSHCLPHRLGNGAHLCNGALISHHPSNQQLLMLVGLLSLHLGDLWGKARGLCKIEGQRRELLGQRLTHRLCDGGHLRDAGHITEHACHQWFLLLLADHRVSRPILDPTLAIQRNTTLDADVAILAPGGPPGVLHLPIVGAVLRAVAYDQDTMVKLRTAGLGQDATCIELECHLVSLDGDRDRLFRHCLHESLLVMDGHIAEANDGALRDTCRALALEAHTILALIGVARLSARSVVLQILESLIHAAPMATHVAILRAVNQLLLAKGHKLSRRNLPGALKCARGGEGPARAARALILRSGHGARRGPVDGDWQVRSAVPVRAKVLQGAPKLLRLRGGAAEAREGLLHLVGRLVRKGCQSQAVPMSLGVLSFDVVEVGLEDVEARLSLLDAMVQSPMLLLKAREGLPVPGGCCGAAPCLEAACGRKGNEE
mmetsp:Transcript_33436/g.75680  ORF Transcript_33436/g.75680 Transcript_33436/m.75680 type:complete len:443 (-) Transcript_33436:127-1455(-)